MCIELKINQSLYSFSYFYFTRTELDLTEVFPFRSSSEGYLEKSEEHLEIKNISKRPREIPMMHAPKIRTSFFQTEGDDYWIESL